jgi:hypothetical protein
MAATTGEIAAEWEHGRNCRLPHFYLSSDEAAFVTGTALLIEGGWTVGK